MAKVYNVVCLARSTKSYSRTYKIEANSKAEARHKILAQAKLEDFGDEDYDAEEWEPCIEIDDVSLQEPIKEV